MAERLKCDQFFAFALDESLVQDSSVGVKKALGRLIPKAIVLKPMILGGFCTCIALQRCIVESESNENADTTGLGEVACIVSSSYESGIALCFEALFACALIPSASLHEQATVTYHGLGTAHLLTHNLLCRKYATVLNSQASINAESAFAALQNTAASLARRFDETSVCVHPAPPRIPRLSDLPIL
uniref:Uncharacterized protein n=1 Tax=Erythrolobus madagascarensis TaxID=708628 RepID=A0A7S0T8L8_9RHOD